MSSMALINGDCKEFSFNAEAFQGSVAFSVVETTDDEVILSRTEELIIELAKQKTTKGERTRKYILATHTLSLPLSLMLSLPSFCTLISTIPLTHSLSLFPLHLYTLSHYPS